MPAEPSAPPTVQDAPAVRRRPADRRRIILDAAARTFSARGYHSTTLDMIAAEVDISVPALYRHFPTKYALFAETSRRLADSVRDAVDGVADGPDAHATLDALLRALVATTLSNRGGGLYRWQSQFLEPGDARYVRDAIVAVHRRVRSALVQLRDDGPAPLSKPQVDALAAAAISAAGSPATHRAPLPAKQVTSTLVTNALSMMCLDVADIPVPPADSHTDASDAVGLAPTSKRELILRHAIPLFADRGFREVSIDDIAQCADLPASGVYRHYANKAAILQTAFWRANDRMIAAIDDALAHARTPDDAIRRLVSSYVGLCCDNTELITVYMAELGNVSVDQQAALRKQQRRNIDEWAGWVVQSRSAVTLPQARFMVHAALSIAFDLTRVPRPTPPELLSAILTGFLLGNR